MAPVPKTMSEPSVLKRMAGILGLFSEDRSAITVDEVGQAIGVSPATAYRYVGELCDRPAIPRIRSVCSRTEDYRT